MPLEGALIGDTGFVREGPLHGNESLRFGEEDGFLGGVRQQDDEEERDEGGDGAEDEEEELPAGDGVDFDVADAVGDDAADDRGNAVAQKPGRLPSIDISVFVTSCYLTFGCSYRAGCSSRR